MVGQVTIVLNFVESTMLLQLHLIQQLLMMIKLLMQVSYYSRLFLRSTPLGHSHMALSVHPYRDICLKKSHLNKKGEKKDRD